MSASLATQLRIHDHLDQLLPVAAESVASEVQALATARGLALSEDQVQAIATQVSEGKAPVTTDMWPRPASIAEWTAAKVAAKHRLVRARWLNRLAYPVALPLACAVMGGVPALGLGVLTQHTDRHVALGMVAALLGAIVFIILREVGKDRHWRERLCGQALRQAEQAQACLEPFDLRPEHVQKLLWVPGLPACMAQALEGEVPFLKGDLGHAERRYNAEVHRRDNARHAAKVAARQAETQRQAEAAHALVREALTHPVTQTS